MANYNTSFEQTTWHPGVGRELFAHFGVVPVGPPPPPVNRTSIQTAHINANLFTPFHASLETLGPALHNWGGGPLDSLDACSTVAVPYVHTQFDADPLPPPTMDWNRPRLDDLRESQRAVQLPACYQPVVVRYNDDPHRFDTAYWNGW